MYIADNSNNLIRKVTASTNIINTVAGSSTSGGYSGDNGAATSAVLSSPQGICLDSAGTRLRFVFLPFINSLLAYSLGNIYIADYSNQRIRKVTVSTGIITTIAGSSTSSGFSGDGGAATSALLSMPASVTLDASGTTINDVVFTSLYLPLIRIH